jgi:hypothetical protein
MFTNASTDHKFIVGCTLRSDQGISHDAFRPASNIDEAIDDAIENGVEEGFIAPEIMDILQTYRHIYVKEVVREPRMHFYKVPRLGSFMAVPLVYNSCLFEDALDEAVNDYMECMKRREE